MLRMATMTFALSTDGFPDGGALTASQNRRPRSSSWIGFFTAGAKPSSNIFRASSFASRAAELLAAAVITESLCCMTNMLIHVLMRRAKPVLMSLWKGRPANQPGYIST